MQGSTHGHSLIQDLLAELSHDETLESSKSVSKSDSAFLVLRNIGP